MPIFISDLLELTSETIAETMNNIDDSNRYYIDEFDFAVEQRVYTQRVSVCDLEHS